MSQPKGKVQDNNDNSNLLDDIIKSWEKIEKVIGSMKCAVTVILIFTLFMIVGTFVESYYGTEFATRVIYKRLPFMLLQFFMFLSIYFATVQRFPVKKRLYGFYVIHAGLMMVFAGSFVTWLAGIDGMIDLSKNSPSRTVVLSQDQARVYYPDTGKYMNFNLPFKAFSTDIDFDYEGIKFKDYLPFSEQEQTWKTPKKAYKAHLSSAKYMLFNPNMSQDFTMSLHPEAANFKPTMNLGKLKINYLGSNLYKCLKLDSPSKLIIWNEKKQTCYTPESKGISIQETEAKNRFIVFKVDGKLLSFFPEFSPLPLDKDLTNFIPSKVRVLSKKLLEDKPTLMIFGNKVGFFNKTEGVSGKWHFEDMSKDKKVVQLPWMGFKLRLIKYSNTEIPALIPVFTLPIQKNGKMIKGDMKAIKVEVNGKEEWVTSYTPIEVNHNGKRAFIQLTKETLTLPFELTLTNFKMQKNPGTKMAASYESFVRLFTSSGSSEHHIFMNNPLKYDSFTFYQSSYTQDPKTGEYGSSLSANIDQGRPLKYLGSLLLVLGAIWYYISNRKRFSTKK